LQEISGWFSYRQVTKNRINVDQYCQALPYEIFIPPWNVALMKSPDLPSGHPYAGTGGDAAGAAGLEKYPQD